MIAFGGSARFETLSVESLKLNATLITFSLALWWLSTPIGRQHIQRSAGLVCLLLAALLLSYYGESGPLKPPALAFPQSDLLELVLGIGFYS